MSMAELLPMVEFLPHTDKLKLMQFLLLRFAQHKISGLGDRCKPPSQGQESWRWRVTLR